MISWFSWTPNDQGKFTCWNIALGVDLKHYRPGQRPANAEATKKIIWHSTNKRSCIIIMNEHIIYYHTAILNTSRCTKGKSKHVYKCIYSSCIKVLQVRRVTLRVGSCSRHRSLSKCTTKVWSVPYNLHVQINIHIYIYHLRDFYPSSCE